VEENIQSELTRLLAEQSKARQDEVFGGMTTTERAEYTLKEKRINELEIELATRHRADKKLL
jgi:hypothetical protein